MKSVVLAAFILLAVPVYAQSPAPELHLGPWTRADVSGSADSPALVDRTTSAIVRHVRWDRRARQPRAVTKITERREA
jgi:hypothetical protein